MFIFGITLLIVIICLFKVSDEEWCSETLLVPGFALFCSILFSIMFSQGFTEQKREELAKTQHDIEFRLIINDISGTVTDDLIREAEAHNKDVDRFNNYWFSFVVHDYDYLKIDVNSYVEV